MLSKASALRPLARLARRLAAGRDRGMVTAEYAVGTLAAVAFAVLLFKIATSPQMVSEMANLFTGAFRAVDPGATLGLR